MSNEQVTFDRAWPVDGLLEQSFERFCTEFLTKLFPNAIVNRYGDRGHKQHGLDIEIAYPDGRLHTAQCKRVASFGPSDIELAIKTHTREAEHKILLLSCIATPNARDTIKSYADWELWDREDVSKLIRQNLSKTEQLQLVDTYFPGQRYNLTGETEASLWRTPEEYFKGMMNNPHGFSQGWGLVGREAELEELISFCSSDSNIALLTANAGMGKTRLLKALAESLPSSSYRGRIYFAAGESAFSKDLAAIGDGPKLIVCDDSHEREDLALFFSFASIPENQTHLIIAFRRYAWSHVVRQAHGFKVSSFPEIRLSKLPPESVKTLAKEALEHYQGNPVHAEQLAEATRDFPLATVMGAQVLAKNSTHPQFLLSHDEFHTEIMRNVIMELTSQVNKALPFTDVNAFLGVLALLQPRSLANDALLTVIEEIYPELKKRDCWKIIDYLLDAGMLFKNGNKYRIAPDLLADFIVEQICIAPDGKSTGFAEKLFKALPAIYTENILVNLGRLDWRKSAGDTRHSKLLDSLWAELKWQRDYSSPHLTAAANVAFYQPVQALAFVRKMIAQGKSGDQLVKILRNIAYNYAYLPEACPLLWELGQADVRKGVSHLSTNGIKTLSHLAEPDLDKPNEYIKRVLDFAISLLPYDRNWTGSLTPIDILKHGLATEGRSHQYEGNKTFSIIPFILHSQSFRAIRHKTLSALLSLLSCSDLSRAYMAAKALEDAVQRPWGTTNNEIAKQYAKDWEKEIEHALKQIHSAVFSGKLSAVIVATLGQVVHHHAEYSKGKIKKLACSILGYIENSLHLKTISALINGWNIVWRTRDIKKSEVEYGKRIDALIDELSLLYKDDSDLLSYITSCLLEIQSAKMPQGNFMPEMFIGKIQDKSETFSWSLLNAAYGDSSSPVYDHAGRSLAVLLNKRHKGAEAIRNTLNQEQDCLKKEILASAYAKYCPEKYTDDDIEALTQIVTSDCENVARHAPWSWRLFNRAEQKKSITLLNIANIGISKTVMHDYFMYICGGDEQNLDCLSEECIKNILEKTKYSENISDYHIAKFLKYIIHKYPQAIIEYFHSRVEAALSGKDPYFRIIDLQLEEKKSLEFYQHPESQKWLFSSLDWAIGLIDKDFFRHMFGKMMKVMYHPFPEQVLEDIQLWLSAGDYKRFEVIKTLLHALPENFVFEQQKFVQAITVKAQEYGEKEVERVGVELRQTIGKSGWVGRGDLDQRELIEKAQAIIANIECFSPVYTLYSGIIEDAEHTIAHRQEMIDEDIDYEL